MQFRRLSYDQWFVVGAVAFVALVLFALCWAPYYAYSTVAVVDAHVTKTERVSYGHGDTLTHRYMIYTTTETFQNTDALLWWKFNSSDIHGNLVPGDYRLKVYGWRVPFFSWYRNVITAAPATAETHQQ